MTEQERADGISTRELGGYVGIAAAILAIVRFLRGRTRGADRRDRKARA